MRTGLRQGRVWKFPGCGRIMCVYCLAERQGTKKKPRFERHDERHCFAKSNCRCDGLSNGLGLPLSVRSFLGVFSSLMVASTRARARLRLCQVCDDFPTDLWIEVLSNLRGKDLGKIACVSKHFRSINDCVWQQACSKRWPEWTSIAQNPETQWRRQYELFELRDKELEAIPDLAAIKKKQRVVNTKHRTILTEWLAEVRLDSPSPTCSPEFTNTLSSALPRTLVPVCRANKHRTILPFYINLHLCRYPNLHFVRLVSLIINLA